MRKNSKVLLSLMMAASMLAGCSGQKSEKPAESGAAERTTQVSDGKEDGIGNKGGKVMTYAIQKEPGALDPIMNNYTTSSTVFQNLLTGLMQIGPGGGLINGYAEKYEISEDGLEYVFTLKGGLKWSDGSLLAVGDFGYAWKRALARDMTPPGVRHLFYLENGKACNEGEAAAGDVDVKAEDDKTLKAALKNPATYFIDLTVVIAYFPVKKNTVEGPEAWTKSADTYMSDGAFRLGEINPQANYMSEKNPEYIDTDTVKLDGVNIVLTESAEAALSAYNAREVDVMDNTITRTQTQPQCGGNDELKSYDLIGTCYYDFSHEKDYPSDARVRKVLAMSPNRDVINQPIIASRPESSYAFVSHGIPYEDPGEDYHTTMGSLFTEDVETAKALAEEAGYPSGEGYLTLTLTTQNDQEKKDMVQAMQAMWKENLGMNVEIVIFELKIYRDEQTAGSFNICYDGWTGNYPGSSTNLDCFLLQRNETQYRWLNHEAKEYDSMMKEARSFTDSKKRMELFETDEKLLMEKTPISPLYYRNAQLLTKPGCEGVIKTYIGYTIPKYISKQQAR